MKTTTTVVNGYYFLITSMKEKLKEGDMVLIDSINRKGRILTMTDTVVLIKLEGMIQDKQFHTIPASLINTLTKIKR